MQPDQATSGSPNETPIAQVLNSLAAKEQTGVLRLSDKSEIWIKAGRIYLAQNSSSHPVESVLFGAGSATKQEIADLMKAPGGDSGDGAAAALATKNPEVSAVLGRLLHEHNLTALFELIVATDVSYEFEDGPTHPVGDHFGEPVEELLAQAERKLDIWKQIAAKIPTTNIVFKLSGVLPEEAEERTFTSDEWRYMSLLDGQMTVADVITSTGESAFRVCSSLYRLSLEGLIVELAATTS